MTSPTQKLAASAISAITLLQERLVEVEAERDQAMHLAKQATKLAAEIHEGKL